jgi:hypothetical protein
LNILTWGQSLVVAQHDVDFSRDVGQPQGIAPT